MKLSGLNTIVTGANQGLGLEIARHYLREGASVAICARDPAKLGALPPDGVAEPFVVDATDPARLDLFLDGATAIISCAGPFARIGLPDLFAGRERTGDACRPLE